MLDSKARRSYGVSYALLLASDPSRALEVLEEFLGSRESASMVLALALKKVPELVHATSECILAETLSKPLKVSGLRVLVHKALSNEGGMRKASKGGDVL